MYFKVIPSPGVGLDSGTYRWGDGFHRLGWTARLPGDGEEEEKGGGSLQASQAGAYLPQAAT